MTRTPEQQAPPGRAGAEGLPQPKDNRHETHHPPSSQEAAEASGMNEFKAAPEELQQIVADHRLWWETGGKAGKEANLDGANLAGAYLVRAYLAGANLAGAYLDGANLAGANLDGANLAGAYLRGANLAGANLAGANLDGAYLAGANLDGANLAGAYLAGAYLAGAYLAGAYLAGARGFEPFVCVGPIGSRQAYTTVYLYQDKVSCGCFTGTLAQFEAKVQKTHAANPLHLAEYTGLITYAKALRALMPERPAEEPEPPAPFAVGDRVHLTAQGKEKFPWFKGDHGVVDTCAGGWTRIEFDDCYMSFANEFVERVAAEEVAS